MKVLSQCNAFVADEKNPNVKREIVPGDVVELPDEIAAEWLKKSMALPLAHEAPEKARLPKVETAAMQGAPESAVGVRQKK